MNFEQAYEQFAAFRHKMQIKWNRMPMDIEDLKQEIDMAFYRAFLKYDERFNNKVGFLTYAHQYINSNIGRLFRDINNDKRVINLRTVSYNAIFENNDNQEKSFESKICIEDSFEESTCGFIDIEKAFEVLKDRDKKIMYLLLRGYSQVEISKILNLYQSNISTFKTNAVKKLKKELAV